MLSSLEKQQQQQQLDSNTIISHFFQPNPLTNKTMPSGQFSPQQLAAAIAAMSGNSNNNNNSMSAFNNPFLNPFMFGLPPQANNGPVPSNPLALAFQQQLAASLLNPNDMSMYMAPFLNNNNNRQQQQQQQQNSNPNMAAIAAAAAALYNNNQQSAGANSNSNPATDMWSHQLAQTMAAQMAQSFAAAAAASQQQQQQQQPQQQQKPKVKEEPNTHFALTKK